MKQNIKSQLFSIGVIFIGNIILAFGVMAFIVPAGLITGGATGLSIALSHYFNIPLETGVTILNVICFIMGLFVLGKKFAFTTLLSTFLYPAALGILGNIPWVATLNTDPLLAAIYGGALTGLGVGLVIRMGASTGGMDIPTIIVAKKLRLSIAYTMYAVDFAILLCQMSFSSSQQVLYGIMVLVATTILMDKVMVIGVHQTQVMIVSPKYMEINDMLQEKLNRGSTLLEALTGRVKKPIKVIMTVVSNRQVPKLHQLVGQVDPNAFIVVNQVNEVKGNGFTLTLDDIPIVRFAELGDKE